jgi:hypothetical protein
VLLDRGDPDAEVIGDLLEGRWAAAIEALGDEIENALLFWG